jgi:hypothetical protein
MLHQKPLSFKNNCIPLSNVEYALANLTVKKLQFRFERMYPTPVRLCCFGTQTGRKSPCAGPLRESTSVSLHPIAL